MTRIAPSGRRPSLIRLGRSLVAVALCAQLAHGVLYESVLPRTGAHGYLSWYLPLLAVAVAAAVALIPASRSERVDGSRRRSLGMLLPERDPGHALRDVARLTAASGCYLLVQESVERTSLSGGVHLASFSALGWLALAVALLVAATVVVALERTLVDLAVRLRRAAPGRPATNGRWSRSEHAHPRPRPLEVHGGLRAPPMTV